MAWIITLLAIALVATALGALWSRLVRDWKRARQAGAPVNYLRADSPANLYPAGSRNRDPAFDHLPRPRA